MTGFLWALRWLLEAPTTPNKFSLPAKKIATKKAKLKNFMIKSQGFSLFSCLNV